MSAVQSIDYPAILPVLLTGAGALAVLVADLFLGPDRKALLGGITAAVLVCAGAAEGALWSGRATPRQTFCVPAPGTVACSYSVDRFSLVLQSLVLAATLFVVLMAPKQLTGRRGGFPLGEYHFLILSSLTGALVMAAARDFITMTVALETLSLPAFALVGFGRRDGAEAALKFFLMSVASTAVMLFGVSLVYGVTGSVYFSVIDRVLTASGFRSPLLAVAIVLALAGFAFKISAVPFHFWTPEVYAGAPVPVAAYLSVVSKTAGFAGLILTVEIAFRTYLTSVATLIAVLAAVTMSVGNTAALRQRPVVRLLAWSTIAQAGYVLVPLAVSRWRGGDPARAPLPDAAGLGPAVGASLAYLVLYAVMNLGAFAVVSALAGRGGLPDGGGVLADYRGLYRTRPRAALPLAFFLLCLAGLPPGVMGLFAKVAVFRAALGGGLTWLAVITAVNVVVALYYYLRWAALLFAPAVGEAAEGSFDGGALPASAPVRWSPVPAASRFAVALLLVAAVVLSVWPNPALSY
jgi:NADH-quinone oxidoreductase subunit N